MIIVLESSQDSHNIRTSTELFNSTSTVFLIQLCNNHHRESALWI